MQLLRTLSIYLNSRLTWRTSKRLAKREPRYHVVARDGYLYVEPRA